MHQDNSHVLFADLIIQCSFNDHVSVISVISSHLRHLKRSFPNYSCPKIAHKGEFMLPNHISLLSLSSKHSFPSSPVTGNSWKPLGCISEAFTVLQMIFEHFLSSHLQFIFFHCIIPLTPTCPSSIHMLLIDQHRVYFFAIVEFN